MKLSQSLRSLLGIAVISLTFFSITGCNKDKDDQPAAKTYRLKSLYNVEDQSTNGVVYSGNQVLQLNTSNNGIMNDKYEWTYQGNEVVITESALVDGAWQAIDYYSKYIYSDNKLSQALFYDGETLAGKTTYLWVGDKVTEESIFAMDSGVVEFTIKRKYTYSGNNLTQADYYFNGTYVSKTVLTYNGNKLVNSLDYIMPETLSGKVDFLYTGDNLTSATTYSVTNGVVGDVRGSQQSTYDANNNIITRVEFDGPDSYTLNFTYEEGTSNLKDFWIAELGWMATYLFPNGVPSMIAGKK